MTTRLSKVDYQKLHAHLGRLLPPGGRPLTAEEVVDVGHLRDKLARCVAESIPLVERGTRILAWRLPCEVAPTQNELINWNSRSPWLPKKAKHWLENEIRKLIEVTPQIHLFGAELVRFVRVTRFTSQPRNVDDAAPDIIGGKLPIDMLVKAGVFVNDSQRWMRREGLVMKTKPGNTHVFVEVFLAADELVPDNGPTDGPKPAFEWPKSKTKKHLEEALKGIK